MNRTDRLYALVEELRAAGDRGRTAAWLADRLEVATRTVKRDVAGLQQAGVPIWAQGGPGGGYVPDAAATLPPVTFTVGEATAIAVALNTQPDLPFGDDGRSALIKLLGAMPPASRAGRWWLFAWCRRDRSGRPFPLDRITDVWLTTETAPPRDVHEVFRDIPADAFALSLPGPA